MKSVSLIIFALLNLTALSSYAAGQQSVADSSNATAPAAQRLVLPLDHGPRAQRTPWLNEQLRVRAARLQQERLAGSGAQPGYRALPPAQHPDHDASAAH